MNHPGLFVLPIILLLIAVEQPGARAEDLPPKYRVMTDKALQWLVQQQHKDGHWQTPGGQFATAMTGLAGMALLMQGSTMRDGRVRIVGKANLHELAFGASGINAGFGTPVNPLDPRLIPGGSSSGSAVAVDRVRVETPRTRQPTPGYCRCCRRRQRLDPSRRKIAGSPTQRRQAEMPHGCKSAG